MRKYSDESFGRRSECEGGPAFGNMDALSSKVPKASNLCAYEKVGIFFKGIAGAIVTEPCRSLPHWEKSCCCHAEYDYSRVSICSRRFMPDADKVCSLCRNHQLSGIPTALGAPLMIRKGSNNNGLSVEDSLRFEFHAQQVWHLPAVDLMDGFIPPVTLEESKIFQKIDRQLYTILVRDLWRNPLECLQIMGLWLWFERVGFSNAISKILSQPLFLINELADEAIACLKCMDGAQFPLQFEATEIPLTQSILQNNVSLKFFHLHRLTARREIQTLIVEVYIPVLSDIMEKVCCGGFGESVNNSQMSMPGHAASGSNLMMAQPSYDDPLMEIFSNINIHANLMMAQPSYDDPLMEIFSNINIHGGTPPSQSNVAQENEQALCERTMFATFSKGYPVTESEIRQFFSRVYGNCVESVHMQEVRVDEQALYARVVFLSPAFLDSILNGMSKAKFSINGKHVWMRKFVPNSGRP